MAVGLGLDTRPIFELRASPQLIEFAELLALPSIELEQRIQRELELNPALERIGTDSNCHVCGDQSQLCPECGPRRLSYPAGARDEVDALAAVVEPTSVYRTALDEARVELTVEELPVAEYLFASLDDRGFLTASLEEISASMNVSLPCVEHVLEVLRSVDSPAIGARGVRECLLLQLDHLERAGITNTLVRDLIANHLDEFARRSTASMSAMLCVPAADIQSALEFIRTHLQPAVRGHELQVWARPTVAARLIPDLAIEIGDEVKVEVLRPTMVRVDRLYAVLATETTDSHVEDAVRRARAFVSRLEERATTLQRIAQRTASEQVGWLTHGQPAARPLTRATIARDLGLHESTVSRAVANKLAVLPDGRLLPLAALFETCTAIHDVLRQLIDAEDRPLSDAQLASHLNMLGYRVARRTVAKYRDQLGIRPASVRS